MHKTVIMRLILFLDLNEKRKYEKAENALGVFVEHLDDAV